MLSVGLVGLMTVSLGCGEESVDTEETESEDIEAEDTNSSEEAEAGENNSSEEEQQEESDNENVENDAEVQPGETVEDENGRVTLISRTDDVGTFESGPIVMEIEKANGASAELEGDLADFMETDQAEYIQVDMTVENTIEEDVTFYASQATLITDTGEQLEPDMWLSDHMDGDYLGAVTKSGSSFYILENSTAEEVESIELRYSAASDTETWDDIGEEIVVETELER